MQSWDENDRLVNAEIGDMLTLLDHKAQIIQAKIAESVIVRPMPKEGEVIELNGLVFRVTRELGRGRFIIKLLDPSDL